MYQNPNADFFFLAGYDAIFNNDQNTQTSIYQSYTLTTHKVMSEKCGERKKKKAKFNVMEHARDTEPSNRR